MKLLRLPIAHWIVALCGLAAYDAGWLWSYRGTLYSLWEEVSRCLSL
jgi:hypothetical protein